MIVPSVTQVLSVYANFAGISDDVLEIASRRGTAVHHSVASWAKDLWCPPLPPAWDPYYQSFLRFIPFITRVIDAEFEIYEKTFGYKGHPDLVVMLGADTEATLLDIKTTATTSRLWRLQTAAYRKGAFKYKIGRHGALHLRADGGLPKLHEYTETYQSDLSIFLQALSVFRFLNN